MFIRQDGPLVRVYAPAKLNLFLEILSKRADGFHEIETLMVAIDRFDTLVLRARSDAELKLDCHVAWSAASRTTAAVAKLLPTDPRDNLVIKALQLLRRRSGCARGAAVTLTKRIPPASGLGGGSSDAAAALLAANIAWQLHWDHRRLAEIAAELGSDIPFFLTRRRGQGAMMAVCRGRGEIIEPVTAPAGMHFVVARPDIGLSTPEVYRRCRPADSPRSATGLIAALVEGDKRAARQQMHNRLQTAAVGIASELTEMARRFSSMGAIAHQLSGSGSAYFGWYEQAPAARSAAARLRAAGFQHAWHAQAI